MASFLNTHFPVLLCTFLIFFSLPLARSYSIHDLLRSKGLPPGLLPKEVKSYTLLENGTLEVFLDGPCLTRFENRVYFESVVRANLTYGSLIGVVGLTQEELFLWLPVKDIIVDDPESGLILFDIGVAHKQLSLSLFEDPPSCKPQGALENHEGGRVRVRVKQSKKMVKFLKPNKAVILLQGRYAGRKAVIVRAFDEGTRDRPYGHCLVAGISKYPSKVIRKDSAKKTAKKSRVKAFIKLVNFQHLMPTRYTLDVDLKDVVSLETLQSRDKKVTAAKETKKRLEERFKSGKNRWFFTKLRF